MMATDQQSTTELTAYLEKRTAPPTPEGHILWNGPTSDYGYGQVSFKGIMTTAHKAAYEAYHGPVPTGMLVAAYVDDLPCPKLCIAPDHLHVVDRARAAELKKVRDHGAEPKPAPKPEPKAEQEVTEEPLAVVIDGEKVLVSDLPVDEITGAPQVPLMVDIPEPVVPRRSRQRLSMDTARWIRQQFVERKGDRNTIKALAEELSCSRQAVYYIIRGWTHWKGELGIEDLSPER